MDQIPLISVSPQYPPSGASQTFTFTVTSAAGTQYIYWINGWISSNYTAGAVPGCVFSFWPTGTASGVIYLLQYNADGSIAWENGAAIGSSDPNPSSKYCTINGVSSYSAPDPGRLAQ